MRELGEAEMMEKLWGLIALVLGLLALVWSLVVFVLTWAVIAVIVWGVWSVLNGGLPLG